jgi:hypothetical protein
LLGTQQVAGTHERCGCGLNPNRADQHSGRNKHMARVCAEVCEALNLRSNVFFLLVLGKPVAVVSYAPGEEASTLVQHHPSHDTCPADCPKMCSSPTGNVHVSPLSQNTKWEHKCQGDYQVYRPTRECAYSRGRVYHNSTSPESN